MTLSDKKVLQFLRDTFVCGWQNIKGSEQAGQSNEHAKGSKPANVNNGSGFHNVQMFVLTSDGRVVHCLPGFWKPDLLLKELEFALTLVKVWEDASLSPRKKSEKFIDAHLTHLQEHSIKQAKESELPSFDQWHETQKGRTDSVRSTGEVKKADQIVHERMADRPFVAFKDFDTAAYVDVGEKFYDAYTDT